MDIAELLKQYEWLLLCVGLALAYFIYTRVKGPEKSEGSPDSAPYAPQGGTVTPAAGTGDSAAITAAISAAVTEYRKST